MNPRIPVALMESSGETYKRKRLTGGVTWSHPRKEKGRLGIIGPV